MRRKVRPLVRAWLWIDFFGETRRTGQPGSSLTSAIFTQSFLALVLAALVFDSTIGPVAYAAANLSLSTLLVGVGALADPQSDERRVADRVLVGTAPVSRLLLPLARTLHGAFHLGLVTIGTAIPPAILFGFVNGGALWSVPGYLLLAVALAGLLSSGLSYLVRVVGHFGGPTRAALVAGTVRALLLGGGLVGFAVCLPRLDETAAALPGGTATALAWPPYWAARFLVAPAADVLFAIALAGAGLVLVVLVVAFGDPEEAGSGGRVRVGRGGLLTWLERRCAGDGPLWGTTRWTSTMLFRSAGFRSRVLPLFGIPLAMTLLAFAEEGTRERTLLLGVTLQLPAIYLPFLVAFLPHADREGAAWMFDTCPHDTTRLARQAAWIALSIRILLPVQVVATAGIVMLGFGPLLAVGLGSFSWALAVAVAAQTVRGIQAVPFTTSADEPPALEFGGLVGFALALAALGGAFAWFASTLPGAAAGVVAAALAARFLAGTPQRMRRAAA